MNQNRNQKRSSRHAFIAVHRGGPLTDEHHRGLIDWAISCSEHVLHLGGQELDGRLVNALDIAKKWESGKVPTGDAMKASLAAHAAAREAMSPVSKAIARSIGQTVATAHMADHSLGGAYYALKAVKYAGEDIVKEKKWQEEMLKALPQNVVIAVQDMWLKKNLDGTI